jgi:hypothetical protein
MARRPQTSSAQVASTIGMRRSDRVKAQVANGKRLESVAIAPAPKRVKPNPKKEEREEDDDDEDTNYGKKTIAQLTNIAKDRGITAALDAAKSRRRKSMIIASIEEFDAQERQEREEQLQEKEQDRLEHLERELEASRDLPYPPIPELLEKGGTMKPKRNGKDVKNWYEPDTKVKSSKNDRYWVFKKNIGEGSYGTCTLWVKSDGKVIVDVSTSFTSLLKDYIANKNRESS